MRGKNFGQRVNEAQLDCACEIRKMMKFNDLTAANDIRADAL